MQNMQSCEIDTGWPRAIAPVHHVDRPVFENQQVQRMRVVQLAVGDVDESGILPRRSSSVCIFTAALVVRKCAQGKSDRHRSMVVESKA